VARAPDSAAEGRPAGGGEGAEAADGRSTTGRFALAGQGYFFAPLVLLDRAELAHLEGESSAREQALRQAKGLFAGLGAPLRVRQIETLLAG